MSRGHRGRRPACGHRRPARGGSHSTPAAVGDGLGRRRAARRRAVARAEGLNGLFVNGFAVFQMKTTPLDGVALGVDRDIAGHALEVAGLRDGVAQLRAVGGPRAPQASLRRASRRSERGEASGATLL